MRTEIRGIKIHIFFGMRGPWGASHLLFSLISLSFSQSFLFKLFLHFFLNNSSKKIRSKPTQFPTLSNSLSLPVDIRKFTNENEEKMIYGIVLLMLKSWFVYLQIFILINLYKTTSYQIFIVILLSLLEKNNFFFVWMQ